MAILNLTDEQYGDLRAIVHGAVARYEREVRSDDPGKVEFYRRWLATAEALLKALPDDAPSDEYDEDTDED